MRSILKTAVVAALTLSGALASAQDTQGGTQIGSGTLLKCRGDVSGINGKPSFLDLELLSQNGKTVAVMNGMPGNMDVVAEEYSISAKTIGMDPESEEVDKLNMGEKRIVFLNMVYSHPEFKELIPALSFDLAQVAKVRLMDVSGDSKTNKFGGVVLIEAFDAQGKFLGRVIASVFSAECK